MTTTSLDAGCALFADQLRRELPPVRNCPATSDPSIAQLVGGIVGGHDSDSDDVLHVLMSSTNRPAFDIYGEPLAFSAESAYALPLRTSCLRVDALSRVGKACVDTRFGSA